MTMTIDDRSKNILSKPAWLLCGLVLLACATAAVAQDAAGAAPAGPYQHLVERLDTDGDGVVTREEFQRRDGSRFDRLDLDGDGQLTEVDFAGLQALRAERRSKRGGGGLFSAADVDRSGGVSAEEWRQLTTALDLDGDGDLTRAELGTFRELRAGEPGTERDPLVRFDADGSGALDAAEQQAIFDRLDADGDGEVSADEAPRPRAHGPRPGGVHLMRSADADQDGRLTRAEWQSFLGDLDADGDRLVTPEERLTALPEDVSTRRGPNRSIELERFEGLFDRLDADADGVITEEERWRRGPRGLGR